MSTTFPDSQLLFVNVVCLIFITTSAHANTCNFCTFLPFCHVPHITLLHNATYYSSLHIHLAHLTSSCDISFSIVASILHCKPSLIPHVYIHWSSKWQPEVTLWRHQNLLSPSRHTEISELPAGCIIKPKSESFDTAAFVRIHWCFCRVAKKCESI